MNEDLTKRLPGKYDGRLDELFQAVQAIRAELSDLRGTVESRLHDTRPIWEKVNTDISQLQERQQRFEERQQRFEEKQQRFEEKQQSFEERQQGFEEGQRRLEAGQESLLGEVREIRTSLRDMNRKFSIFNDTLVGIQADYRDIYDRLREIERHRA